MNLPNKIKLWISKFIQNRIILLPCVYLLASCSNQVSEDDWPIGINAGVFKTSEKLYVYTEENRNLFGADVVLSRRKPLGGREHGEIKDISIGTNIYVEKFMGIAGYGVKSWFVYGNVETEPQKFERFTYESAFGYKMPNEISLPWK